MNSLARETRVLQYNISTINTIVHYKVVIVLEVAKILKIIMILEEKIVLEVLIVLERVIELEVKLVVAAVERRDLI